MSFSPLNQYERNILTFAREDVQIHDYYITTNGAIVRVDSPDSSIVEIFSNLSDYLSINTQEKNLRSLLNRVRSLRDSEAAYDQDTRERMCTLVLRKFQQTYAEHKERLEQKQLEIATQKAEVADLLDSVLPQNPSDLSTDADPIESLSDVKRELDSTFRTAENMARLHLQGNPESCATAARKYS